MAQKKKQHFVPRFYLKGFSENGRSINLLHLRSGKIVNAAALKNQCYRDYFYGKEETVENALASIEGEAASIFREIRSTNQLPPVKSEQRVRILLYLLAQHARTSYAAEALNESVSRLARHLVSRRAAEKGFTADDLERVRFGWTEPGRVSVSTIIPTCPLLFDLSWRLILTVPGHEFITSDNPVVFYNQFFEYRSGVSHCGIACKGLEIFFPLDPEHLLLVFDGDVYSTTSAKRQFIPLHNLRDMHELNRLQYVSAEENIYFRDSGPDPRPGLKRAAQFRRPEKTSQRILPGHKPNSEFIVTHRHEVRTGLKLTFINSTRAAKKWRDDFRRSPSQPATVVRDPQLCDDHTEFLRRMDAGEYKPHEFSRFVYDKYGSGN